MSFGDRARTLCKKPIALPVIEVFASSQQSSCWIVIGQVHLRQKAYEDLRSVGFADNKEAWALIDQLIAISDFVLRPYIGPRPRDTIVANGRLKESFTRANMLDST